MRVIRRDSVSYLACFDDFCGLSKLLPKFFVLNSLQSEFFPVDGVFSMRVIQNSARVNTLSVDDSYF